MLAVNTDANGAYVFAGVPDGNYRIAEAFGTIATASPGNFSAAMAGDPVKAAFPPISYAPNPPANATNLDAVTPSTLLVTVSGTDLTGQDILNGPVRYTPIQTITDTGVIISPQNLITSADAGTFGAFPQGTPANTGMPAPAYTDIGTEFQYALPNTVGITPAFRQYTVQNIMNDATANVQQTWWRIADHTSGNETGRMMVINGDAPGSVIFEQMVAVRPDTYYLFSSWILNLSKSAALADPQLGVAVLTADGGVLYRTTLGALIPMDPDTPEWKQIGTVLNSRNNSSLTVRFISMGPEAYGNDYAIDDIALNEVSVIAYTPQKSAGSSAVNVGDTVVYTVTLANTGMNPLTDVTVRDAVPDGFVFVPGSVVVNSLPNAGADPNAGFAVPDIPGGGTLTVTFSAAAEHIPAVNPALNTAQLSYSYSPVRGGIPDTYTLKTNDTPVQIRKPDDPPPPPPPPPPEEPRAGLSVTKTAYPCAVTPCGYITYTITVTNEGPSEAADTVLTDKIPQELFSARYSADNGRTYKAWSGSLPLGTLPAGASVTVLIRAAVRQCVLCCSVTNAAEAASATPGSNPVSNRAEVRTMIVYARQT
jgi:uncharacterized repeat protein (TIGR01451 family)